MRIWESDVASASLALSYGERATLVKTARTQAGPVPSPTHYPENPPNQTTPRHRHLFINFEAFLFVSTASTAYSNGRCSLKRPKYPTSATAFPLFQASNESTSPSCLPFFRPKSNNESSPSPVTVHHF
ncbi:hypothetical protein RchiOBHm_Chr7g0177441 [Rosa chinensis]|uniref:Uncharacterized protein n=1 Tax=Rosa chinensis TaxID=74649 RepID=A0A2P6P1J7_ROSCH|nr:hypothetical protein RchiOBHm_Chr7g0177441 [Rosa chinensis]